MIIKKTQKKKLTEREIGRICYLRKLPIARQHGKSVFAIVNLNGSVGGIIRADERYLAIAQARVLYPGVQFWKS